MSRRLSSHFLAARPWFVVVAVTTSVGCGDPLKEAQRVEELRVLGARVEVEGSPERATPAPGEPFRVSVLVRDPSGIPETVWALRACRSPDATRGVPRCTGDPFAFTESDGPSRDAPVLEGALPEDVQPGDRIAVHGVVCDGGSPELALDPLDWSCGPGASEEVRFSYDFWVGGEGEANLNPDLAGTEVTLDGASWPMAGDCASADGPRITAGTEPVISFELPTAAREPVATTETRDDPFETLQISHFATRGLLDRQFSSIEPNDEDFVRSIPWKAPDESPDPSTARFTFVVRDLRGGVAWFERELCLQP